MTQNGYLVGVHVKPRKPDELPTDACNLWKIDEMCETYAVLSPTGVFEDKSKMVEYLSLKEKYAICNTKPQIAVDASRGCPEKNSHWAIKYAEAQIYMALNSLSHQAFCDDIYLGVQVFVNPWAVTAPKDFGEGELLLTPATMASKSL